MTLPFVAPAAPAPTAVVPDVDTGIENLLGLVRHSLLDRLAGVRRAATRLEDLRSAGFLPTTLAGERVFVELADDARQAAETLERLANLGDILVGAPILADEHVQVGDLLGATAGELAALAQARRVGLRLDDGHQNLAPVYGSRRWIAKALSCLLARLVEAAPAGAHVALRLRQVGFHQLLTAGVANGPPATSMINLLRRGAQGGAKAAVAAAASPADLDLALVRAVVELHGGSLKTELSDEGALEHVTLSLPTGEPQAQRGRPDCANCPSLRQAERFAADIGELLNGLHAGQDPIHTGSTS